jgi:hypothetical protein
VSAARRAAVAAAAFLLAACGSDARTPDDGAPREGATAPGPTPGEPWHHAPSAGVRLRAGGVLTVETGPHAVLWPADAPALSPPYVLRAVLRKHAGRLHEGYGVVFGADPLGEDESTQRYSYFLVRGDGSYLVKRRDGVETPVVRDWTRHPRIHRESPGAAPENRLEVRVGVDTTAFLVNEAEVERVPSSVLSVSGRAGVRVAHDVVVEVVAFQAAPDPAEADP